MFKGVRTSLIFYCTLLRIKRILCILLSFRGYLLLQVVPYPLTLCKMLPMGNANAAVVLSLQRRIHVLVR